MNFLNNRKRTRWVKASAEPYFNQEYYFCLQPDFSKSLLRLNDINKLSTPIELAVLKQDEKGERDVIAIKQIEWRFVL